MMLTPILLRISWMRNDNKKHLNYLSACCRTAQAGTAIRLIYLLLPNPDKLEITNYKRQITSKLQIQINEFQNGLFRLLKLGFWNLFVIWDLSFVI